MNWLTSHFAKPDSTEQDLAKQVREEHVKLRMRRARVDKVLADFHRADAVVMGEKRGKEWPGRL